MADKPAVRAKPWTLRDFAVDEELFRSATGM